MPIPLFLTKKNSARLVKPLPPELPGHYHAARLDYVTICTPRDGKAVEEARADFDILATDPRVELIAIERHNKVMRLLTKEVVLLDEKNIRRRIGAFILTISRPEGKAGFINCDRTVELRDSEFHHPHCFTNNGGMCTTANDPAQMAIKNGLLAKAALLYLDALWTYGPNTRTCNGHYWPVYEEST